MRTYYINNGNENGGPFTFEELKNQPVYKTTLIWYQGMDEWKHAENIEELNSLFTVQPPPIKRIAPIQDESNDEVVETILGLKKSYFYLAVASLVIFIFIITLNIIQESKKNELELKNKETEFSNEKVKLQRKEFNEQRFQDEVQKRITTENNNKRRKDSINNRLTVIKNELIDNKRQLILAQKDLDEAEEFKLLRSESTRDEQLQIIQNDIEEWRKEINKLENEANRLYLEIETIH
jgi:hypothetical protein